jgi:hypothetical protein
LGFAILPDSGDPVFGPQVVSRPLAAGKHSWVFETAAFWRRDEATTLVQRIVEIASALSPLAEQKP